MAAKKQSHSGKNQMFSMDKIYMTTKGSPAIFVGKAKGNQNVLVWKSAVTRGGKPRSNLIYTNAMGQSVEFDPVTGEIAATRPGRHPAVIRELNELDTSELDKAHKAKEFFNFYTEVAVNFVIEDAGFVEYLVKKARSNGVKPEVLVQLILKTQLDKLVNNR